MVDSIVLTLPEAPSANQYWRRHGHVMHVSAAAKAYKDAVAMLTSKYRQQLPHSTATECTFPSGDLSLTVLWHRSSKRGDLDNRLKILGDALQGCVFRKDAQIAEIHAQRVDQHATVRKGYMKVTIERASVRGNPP
jgi:Holliday junction resolvase RusA-like endonuclease